MKLPIFLSAFLALLALALPAFAHHPGAELDRVMGSKEKYFEAVDRPAPDFTLQDAVGRTVGLTDFRDKVVVLNFIYAKCPDICPLHAEKIAAIQGMINETPMRSLVQFITITTDPARDTPEALKAYGPAHGLDPSNWVFLTIPPGGKEDATRKLAQAFGHSFVKGAEGYQTHGIVTHVIDRGGRWAANFHGLRFEPVNAVLYVNGLVNAPHAPEAPEGLWDRLKGLFR